MPFHIRQNNGCCRQEYVVVNTLTSTVLGVYRLYADAKIHCVIMEGAEFSTGKHEIIEPETGRSHIYRVVNYSDGREKEVCKVYRMTNKRTEKLVLIQKLEPWSVSAKEMK